MKVKDHSISGKEFSLVFNENYEMYVTEPKPSQADLPLYYKSEDYISHTDGSRTFLEKLYQAVKGVALSRKQNLIKSYLHNKGSVLDIGSGTGDFLKYLETKSWNTVGMEPNEQARGRAREKNIKVEASLDKLSGSFDCITMWHVLEHVYDLNEQIAWLKKHLALDGFLFIAVPNFKSWDALNYKEFWAAYDVPRHLYHFSQKSIQRLFENEGFQLVEVHPMKFDAYYVSLLSEKYKYGKMNYLRAFLNGYRSNRAARKTGEYSSLIYVITHRKI